MPPELDGPSPIERSTAGDATTSGRHAGAAVAIALAAIALFDTPVFSTVWDAITGPPIDYVQSRREGGFGGLPVDAIAASLSQRLPISEPVVLGEGITNNPLYYQRFCEALYPRLIAPAAPHRLIYGRAPGATPLLAGAMLVGPPAPAVLPLEPLQTLTASPLRALLLFLSLLGLGLAAMAGAARLGIAGLRVRALSPGLYLPTAVLAGAVSVALICSVGSWLGVSVHWDLLAGVGLLALFATLALGATRLGRREALARARAALPALLRAEVLVGLVGLAALVYLVDRSPIVAWDARSIWFFRAKQMFIAGRFLPIDARTYSWAHPGYPLLYPSVIAFFSAFGGWDERRGSVAIAVLLGSLLSLVFVLARRTLGRWAGAAFAIVPGAYLLSLGISGMSDGYISLCLLVAVLGFASEETEPVGWLGAFSAALIKREGFVFAFVLCAFFSLIGAPSRGRRWARRALPFLGFVPFVVHALWVRHLGTVDAYADAKLPAQAHDIWLRVTKIWDAIRALGFGRSPIRLGVAGLALTVAYARRWRVAPSGMIASLTGLAALAFTFAVFTITPFDLAWHLGTALDRVVLDFALLLTAGGVLLASTPGPA